MFGFLKKKETKKEVERHEIPEQNRMEIYELIDKFEAETGGKREKFAVWAKLQKIFPSVDIVYGSWAVDLSNILAPAIYRKSIK